MLRLPVSLNQELFPACCLSSTFCYTFFFKFCASSQSLLLFRFSCLSFPAHTAPLQEVSPVANIPKFLSTYTVFLPLEAWNLLENGKCLFIPWVQNTVKTKDQIFSAFRVTHESQTSQTKWWGENFPGVLGTSQNLYQSWETRSKLIQAPEQVSNVFQPD